MILHICSKAPAIQQNSVTVPFKIMFATVIIQTSKLLLKEINLEWYISAESS